MTLAQSRRFVLRELAHRYPVYFSEEALVYIHSNGGLDGRYIKWHGETYTIVEVHEASRIVEAVRTQRRLQPTDRLEPEPFSMLITDQAWRALPVGASLEYVRVQLALLEQGATRRCPSPVPRAIPLAGSLPRGCMTSPISVYPRLPGGNPL
mgnify:CR=1 FL=1